MIYRNFAIATVVIAPLIAMAAQSLIPTHHASHDDQAEPSVASPAVATPAIPTTGSFAPPPQPVMEAAPPPASASPPAPTQAPAFGQPLTGAGEPMLAPGRGLPDNGGEKQATTPPAGGFAVESSRPLNI